MSVPRNSLAALCVVTACVFVNGPAGAAPEVKYASHPPLQVAPPPSDRPMADGPACFVDPVRGDDAGKGTKDAPWKTLKHALGRLTAGDTLYLRGGTYYENVYCAVAGEEGKPITLRSFPGEQAILDGGLREFFESPAESWEPARDGVEDEYVSKRAYPNARDFLGAFGDSMIGLNTYNYVMDLRAKSDLWNWQDWSKQKQTDADPLYCGPGLWYDVKTGHIHARLAHSHLSGVPNYEGETDPRKLPLVIAPFRAITLYVDHARNVRFQDLVLRGAGFDLTKLDYAVNVEFDNCTFWCGTYGICAVRTGPLKATHCGIYGSVPPWLARSDTSKRAYPGSPNRDITRLNTHAPWVIEAGYEFSVFATPVNDNWEISYCDFADSHDGPYFGGVNLRFHHNTVTHMQDDGIYLSPMYPRHLYARSGAEIHLYQNYISGVLTALAFGGAEDTNKDKLFIYRNVFDMRGPAFVGRPSTKEPKPKYSQGKLMGDHGSPPWPEMTIYQNTFVCGEGTRFSMPLLGGLNKDRPRKLLNNLVVNLEAIQLVPATPKSPGEPLEDGNLFWCPGADVAKAEAQLRKTRYAGQGAADQVADPKFLKLDPDPKVANDYRLQKDSPAVDRGVALPEAWDDPLRGMDAGKPDIGALPLGAAPFEAGRKAR